MAHDSTVITIVIIVIVLFLVLWLVAARSDSCGKGEERHHHKKKHSHKKGCGCEEKEEPCHGCEAEVCLPPSNVTATSTELFKLRVGWKCPPCDVDHYKVFIRYTCEPPPPQVQSSRKLVKDGHCAPPSESCCDNYDQVVIVAGDQTSVVVHPIKQPCVCVCVVAVNKCGVPSAASAVVCTEINCDAYTRGWIVESDCRGLTIRWEKIECATAYRIYYKEPESEPELMYELGADAQGASGLPPINDTDIIVFISVVTPCGEGPLTEVGAAQPL